MKLEFWLDYLSPICYLQHKSLETLFDNYIFKDLELLYRSYEMIPYFQPENDCSFDVILSKHHVISLEEARKIMPEIHPDLKPVPVLDAHRLSHLAKKEDCAFAYNKNVFKAYYEENKDISNHEILKEIAIESGLDRKDVDEVLASDLYKSAVESNRENAILKGIFELPHMRIDGKMRLSGYHTHKALLQQLARASAQYTKNEYCEGENCEK